MAETGETGATASPPAGSPEGDPLASLPAKARELAVERLEGRRALRVVRTQTRVDVGGWLGRRRVWLVVHADGLLLVATGRPAPRPLAQNAAFDDLQETVYNHVTASLVLAPAKDLAVRSLKMDPAVGAELLETITGRSAPTA
jgi:hypothetical protein